MAVNHYHSPVGWVTDEIVYLHRKNKKNYRMFTSRWHKILGKNRAKQFERGWSFENEYRLRGTLTRIKDMEA